MKSKYEMRRSRQKLSEADVNTILHSATSGILSLNDADGYPYGVPMSFVFDNLHSIYFHSAKVGHKIDCIKADSRCAFSVIVQDEIVPEKFTTYFKSVLCQGRVSIVCDGDEIVRALELLCRKYSPAIDSSAEIKSGLAKVCILRLDIESIAGKQAIELVR